MAPAIPPLGRGAALAALLVATAPLQAMDAPAAAPAPAPASAPAASPASAPGAAPASASAAAAPPAARSTDIRAHVLPAMDRIEAARLAGRVMYPEDYARKHPNLTAREIMMLAYGMTTHSDLFEQSQGPNNPLLNFRLRPFVSASAALDTLLDSGETVLDCGAVTGLAYMLAGRMAFEARHGAEKGRLRFDYLWGSAQAEVPAVQRLLLTNNGMVAGTRHYRFAVDGNPNPLNPFSFFMDFSAVAHAAARKGSGATTSALKASLPVGSLVPFHGHPRYHDKHPAGIDGCYNGVVAAAGQGDLSLRFFGDDGRAHSEAQLLQRHVAAYNQPADPANALAQLEMRASGERFPERIEAHGVPGLSLEGHMDIQPDRWTLLLEAPMTAVLPAYRRFLNDELAGRLGMLPEDHTLPELQGPGRPRVYAVANCNAYLGQLLTFRIARTKGKNETHTLVEMDSAYLTAPVRAQLGLERRSLLGLSAATEARIRQHPEFVLEPDLLDPRILVTLPKESLPKLMEILGPQA